MRRVTIRQKMIMKQTISENLFEQLCNENGIQWTRISEMPDMQTADYKIILEDQQVIVEIKQLDPNSDDKERFTQVFQHGGVVSYFTTSKRRARKKIKSSKTQLKNSAAGQHPTILVLYDNTSGFSGLDEDSVLDAMYGDEIYLIPPNEQTAEIEARFGGNQQMTESSKKYISAIGILDVRNRKPILTLFHNSYADMPIGYDKSALLAQAQFRVEIKDGKPFRYGKLS